MTASFEIKSAQLPLMTLLLKTENLPLVISELLQSYGPESESADFFDFDGILIDLSKIRLNFSQDKLNNLMTVLRQCRLTPVALRSLDADTNQLAQTSGLILAPTEQTRRKSLSEPKKEPSSVVEVIKEVVREVPGPATLVVDKPVRSGQKIYARGSDLVLLAMVNQGGEVVADGHIHVYAPLRGKAMAGASGNVHARIFSTCLEPELISIAGVYRTSENPLAEHIQGKAAQVRLSADGKEKLLFDAIIS